MEDVLASIRRILEDGPEESSAVPHQTIAAEAEPVMNEQTTPHPVAPPVEDVFDLDAAMMIEEQHPVADTPTHADPHAPLLAPETQTAATASLGQLMRKLTERHTAVYKEGPTLEDLVREEMRPIVKTWLDANIAPMVERLVREEIERVVRLAVG